MVTIKTPKEIEIMHQGGKKLGVILRAIGKEVKPGTHTFNLEEMACELIAKAGGRPAFKGYRTDRREKPYPTALCISINDEVVHAPAIPNRVLIEGDIVGIDIGMQYPFGDKLLTGYYTDMAATFAVGKVSAEAKKLMEVTRKSLELAIKTVKAGGFLSDIGKAIEPYVKKNGFSVVRDLVGHGVGYAVHEDPNVPNFVFDRRDDLVLKEGMTLAIEPMVNAGKWHVITDPDGMAIRTADGSLSAHFEHTVAVTKNGCIILTE